jgi:hypothetical protein
MTTAIVKRSHWNYLIADAGFRIVSAHFAQEQQHRKEKREKKMIEKGEIRACLIEGCGKTLGQESRDLGFKVCHTHRECAACGSPVNSQESSWCLNNDIPIKHARCMRLNDVNTLDAQIQLTNFYRLLTDMTTLVSEMSFEQKMEVLRRSQDFCAFVSLQLDRKKADLSKQLNEDREAKVKKQADAKRHEVATSNKTHKRHKNLAAQAIQALTKNDVKYSIAAQTILAQEIKTKGVTPEQARLNILEAMIALGTPQEDAAEILDGRIQ